MTRRPPARTTNRGPSAAPRRAGGPPISAVLGHGDVATSLLFIFPVFLVYEVGVVFAPALNGVDFLSLNLFAALGHSKTRYLLVYGVFALVYTAVLLVLHRKRKFHPRRFGPMLLESGIFALTIGSFILFVMRKLGLDPALQVGARPDGVTGIVVSLGAGVHEELVFRLGMCGGGAALLRLLRVSHTPAVVVAMVLSSLAFSAAHHLGAAGEPWAFGPFVYRAIAGGVFACIFYFRSLATAVYTHALYDVYVLVILG